MCLDADARAFLADCQAGLIEGGLDHMRRRRQELLAAHQQDAPEAVVIIDASEDQLLEQVGMALDALRLAEIVRQVFASIRERHAGWEVARAFLAGEAAMRESMIAAVRAHGAGNSAAYENARTEILRRILAAAPTWTGALPTIEAACAEVSPGDLRLLAVIAEDDLRAGLVVDLMAGDRQEALDYLREVAKRIDTLLRLEADAS